MSASEGNESKSASDRHDKPNRKGTLAVIAVLISLLLLFVAFQWSQRTRSFGEPPTPGVVFGPASPWRQGNTYFDNLTILQVRGSVNTSSLGLMVQNISPALPIAPAVCQSNPVNGISSCTAPQNGWYAVLVDSAGQWLASFPVTSPYPTEWTNTSIDILQGQSVVVVSSVPLHDTGADLDTYGLIPPLMGNQPAPL